MKHEIEVLGCSGSAEPGANPTCYLVDRTIAIDGGALASALPLARQRAIDTVLLTHQHFDHLRDLPLFLDNAYAMRQGRGATVVRAEPRTIANLKRHVFNGEIWSEPWKYRPPAVRFAPFALERPLRVGPFTATPIRVYHSAPTVGFLFAQRGATAAILGDTGYDVRLYARLARVRDLRLLVIEVSYPNRLEDLARRAFHQTPAQLATGLAPLWDRHERMRVVVVHVKPPWRRETERQLRALRPRVTIARDGDRYAMFD